MQALVRLRRAADSTSVEHDGLQYAEPARAAVAQGALGNVNDACFRMQFAYGYNPAEAASWQQPGRDGRIGNVASHCFYMMEYLLDDQIHAVRCLLSQADADRRRGRADQ